MSIDPAAMERYRATALRRAARRRSENRARRDRAMAVAEEAARFLRREFGATRVVAFGSLVDAQGKWFGVRSDIDLAAWSIPKDVYLHAVGQLLELSNEFSIDLITMEDCPEHLTEAISKGIDL